MKFKVTGLVVLFVAVFGTIFIASSVSNETSSGISEVATESEILSESPTSTNEFIWPESKESISCDYDCYEDHLALDFSQGLGTDVLASKAGTVVEAGYDNLGKGYYVLLDHGDGVQTLYAHLDENLAVAVGDIVEQGQVIGYEGESGSVTGPNTHFEIIVDGIRQNPNDFLQ